jgi:hypothetical protein
MVEPGIHALHIVRTSQKFALSPGGGFIGAIAPRSLFAFFTLEELLVTPTEQVGKAKRLPTHGHCNNWVMSLESVPVLNRPISDVCALRADA